MSDFLKVLNEKRRTQAESVAMTIRVSEEDDAKIKDLADYADCTRQELIMEAIKRYVLPTWDSLMNQEKILDDDITDSGQRYYLLNTNKGNSIEDHHRMLNEGIAAAFEDGYMEKINKIPPESMVFLYESGRGIVAYGIAEQEVFSDSHYGVDNKMRYRKLRQFCRLEKPLSAKEISAILKYKFIPIQTLIHLKGGKAIMDAIKQNA